MRRTNGKEGSRERWRDRSPKQEYKKEAFEMFTTMLDRVKSEVVTILAKVQLREDSDVDELERRRAASRQDLDLQHASASAPSIQAKEQQPEAAPFIRDQPKIGRNEPCHCGSGKKFKQCHGKLS